MSEASVLNPPGHFSWVDLATTDSNAAKSFYTGLFGWTFDDQPAGPDQVYTMLLADGKEIGALFQRDPSMPGPPAWNSYVMVENVDETIAENEKLGGTLFMGPHDVMDKGRMAILADPGGAVFCIWQAGSHHGMARKGEPGAACWFELMTKDVAQAGSYYGNLFGWDRETHQMPMTYTVFKAGDREIAGMMSMDHIPAEVPPHWLIYFSVTDTDAIVASAKALGAGVMAEPMDIEGVGRLAVLTDPQGAFFAVITEASK